MKKLFISIPFVIATSVLAAFLILASIYVQFSGIKSLSGLWSDSISESSIRATQLAEIERNLGYVGFIHNFKNYVIRGTEEYYLKANANYLNTKQAIDALRRMSLDQEDLLSIQIIESTLEEYQQKLSKVHNSGGTLTPNEIDKMVKVSDTEAEKALIALRSKILPRMLQQQAIAAQKGDELANTSMILLLFMAPVILLTFFVSIRAIKELLDNSKEMSAIFNTSPDGMLYVDNDGKILKANYSAESIFGYSKAEFEELYIEDLVEETFRERHVSWRQRFNQKEQTRQIAERNLSIKGRQKDGSLADIEVGISSKYIGGVIRTVCVIKDVRERNQLIEHSVKDHLTSVHNRRYFDETAERELQRSIREEYPTSLLLIDIDNFKPLNDTLGHHQGDLALKLVADFLKERTRSYDCLARWGGDEFVLLCPGLKTEDSVNYAKRIHAEFETLDFPWEQELTLSIGIATSDTTQAMHKDELLNAADKALYQVKQRGRNSFAHFSL